MSSSQASGYVPLPDSFRPGLTAIMVCCGISCAATFFLLSFLSYQTIKAKLSRDQRRPAIQNSAPQGYFWLVQLFIADFIESFSGLFVSRYLTTNSLITGPYCTFQAVGLISGVLGSAIWTFVFTVNTFLLLAGGRNTRAWLIEKSNSGWERWVICIAIWIFILFSGLFGFIEPSDPSKGPYYDQLGTGWCYIAQNYRWEGIFFTYSFLFLDMATLTVLYSILFFFLRAQTKRLLKSSITTDQQTGDDLTMTSNAHQWEARLEASDEDLEASPASPAGPVIVTKSVSIYTEAHPNTRTVRPNAGAQRTYQRINKVSATLLIYPVLYMILNMPISMARIAEFAGQEWGINFVHFGAALFECTGWINVLLYTSTRKGLVSWNRLAFWKRDASVLRSSSRRARGWTVRDPPGDDVVTFDAVQMTRKFSKTSASSIAALKEEMSRGAVHSAREGVESDGDSHLGS